MHHVQSAESFPFRNHARDANLTRALRDHLNVDIAVAQGRKQPSGNADAPLQLQPHQTDNGHVPHDIHAPILAQLLNRAAQVLVLVHQVLRVLFSAAVLGALDDGRLGVHGQTDVELVLFKEVNVERAGGEDLADVREEVCVFDFAVGVHVDDGDLVFYGHGGWALGVGLEVGVGGRGDEGAGALGREDVLDADGDRRETLLYCEMVDYFGAVEG